METISLNKEILDQIDRQIDFAYFVAGITVTLALVIITYQIVISEKRLKQIKKENEEQVKEITSSLFMFSIEQMTLKDYVELDNSVKKLVEIYHRYFNENVTIRNQMKELKYLCLRSKQMNMAMLDTFYLDRGFHNKQYENPETLYNDIKNHLNANESENRNIIESLDEEYQNYLNIIKVFEGI